MHNHSASISLVIHQMVVHALLNALSAAQTLHLCIVAKYAAKGFIIVLD
jgi:hypothetical protein